LSYGSDSEDVLLKELAAEARHYLDLLGQLQTLPEGDERDTKEGKLYGSIAHLGGHSRLLQKRLDKLVEEDVCV
jgi:hypothetical protein